MIERRGGNFNLAGSGEFDTRSYTMELHRLRKLLDKVREEELRQEIITQIAVLQQVMAPVVTEYLQLHPEANKSIQPEDLYELLGDTD